MDAAAGVVLGDLDPASAAVPDDLPLADAVGAATTWLRWTIRSSRHRTYGGRGYSSISCPSID